MFGQINPFQNPKPNKFQPVHKIHITLPSNGNKAPHRSPPSRRPRVLCLHGFRCSGEILNRQLADAEWPESILGRLDLFFPDAPFPAQGLPSARIIYGSPYYEWFQTNEDLTKYTNFDECLAYIEDLAINHGPFDGLMGMSQGGVLTGLLPGLQKNGLAMTRVAEVKFIIVIAGGRSRNPSVANQAYSSSPLHCPSLHFIGEHDELVGADGLALLGSYVDPVVILHPGGHEVPKLDEKAEKQVSEFIDKVQNMLNFQASKL
uniref:Serine hydrolase domain-containing protein n=1 Tax=Kalanchoe fedtschenkoi TaxID=63787 RepID=A0A7N0ULU2_KALFE